MVSFVFRIVDFLYLETIPNLMRRRSITKKQALHETTPVSKSSQLYRIPRMPTENEAALVFDKKF
jgi:hypothetical protein